MNEKRICAYLLLNRIEHQASVSLQPVLEAGLDVEEIASFTKEQWESFFSIRKVQKIMQVRSVSLQNQDLEYLQRHKVGVLTQEDLHYPNLLKEIYNPPLLMFYLGVLPPSDALHIAVVGSREATLAGKCLAAELGEFLSGCQISVVSGFARGIDRACHKGVLAGNGRAVGVIACGISEFLKPKIYPFYDNVLKNGCVFSEFPVDFPVWKRNFLIRNRIITGMSLATVVIEARLRSGTMVSARHALEQGREIFAIPGPVHSESSAGPNYLIRSGATLVSSFSDILVDLGLSDLLPKNYRSVYLTETEQALYDFLTKEPVTIEDISYRFQKSLAQTLSLLMGLEGKKLIRRLPGNRFCRFFHS